MKVTLRLSAIAAAAGALLASAGAALAGLGQPTPWQLGLQEAASPVMADIIWFHNYLLWIIAAITAFVLGLLLIIILRFNARANPTPARTTHNTLLEVAWTIIPVVILIAIAIPSFRLLFLQLDVPTPDITVKATGKQWFWSYSYPDNGNFEFDSLIVADKDLKAGQPRLLTVDNEMVVPVNKVVHVLVTGAVGTYYGQCSELCGKNHAFMPITVRVVNDNDFTAWVAQAKKNYGSNNSAPPDTFAAAGAAAPR
jgi:cytochrome c oxidase subunit 2